VNSVYALVESPGHEYAGHLESPRRFALLKERLLRSPAERLDSAPATRSDIMSVHDEALLALVEAAAREGPLVIDYAPTYVTKTSFEDALRAAGGALTCTRAVLEGKTRGAFAIARPPGHHAEPDRVMGFCLFNNIAIAARHALAAGLQRVMIVDYDAHHGNGTQAVFLDDERVAFISLHQWGIYPGTGWFEEAPKARKRIVNVPLEAGAGDKTYVRVLDDVVRPLIDVFRPEMLFVSAGFDAHWRDPITSLGVSTRGFFEISSRLVRWAEEQCGGRIVFVLEGGYDPVNVANGSMAVFAALAGDPTPPIVNDAYLQREPDQSRRIRDVLDWHGLPAAVAQSRS
jgi:acetoin utilization deacetylase AcuC-like enzyme